MTENKRPRRIHFFDKVTGHWHSMSQHGSHTSGLNPLVKAFIRLSVVPSSTPLQFSSTLNKAWVAHEFGIS